MSKHVYNNDIDAKKHAQDVLDENLSNWKLCFNGIKAVCPGIEVKVLENGTTEFCPIIGMIVSKYHNFPYDSWDNVPIDIMCKGK